LGDHTFDACWKKFLNLRDFLLAHVLKFDARPVDCFFFYLRVEAMETVTDQKLWILKIVPTRDEINVHLLSFVNQYKCCSLEIKEQDVTVYYSTS